MVVVQKINPRQRIVGSAGWVVVVVPAIKVLTNRQDLVENIAT